MLGDSSVYYYGSLNKLLIFAVINIILEHRKNEYEKQISKFYVFSFAWLEGEEGCSFSRIRQSVKLHFSGSFWDKITDQIHKNF